MLWTKAAYQSTVFQTFECSNKSSSLYFCSSNLSTKTTLHKKSPLTRNVRTFEWLGENLPNSSYTFETTSQFFLKLYITLQCHERKLFCIFFQLKLYMIWAKGNDQSAKFNSFDCSRKISPNLYFDKFLLLKLYKILAKKKQRGVMSRDTEK